MNNWSGYTLKVETYANDAYDYWETQFQCSPHPGDITANFAGTTVTYDVASEMLRFNSTADVNSVLNQLDAEYETYNNNYDNLHTNHTVDQLDDIDATNNFDEFYKFKQFENLFPGFNSKRKQIEAVETIWVNNSFAGTDPDDLDLMFDDAENTIFNTNYSFKVANATYKLTNAGLYINGELQSSLDGGRLSNSPLDRNSNSSYTKNTWL